MLKFVVVFAVLAVSAMSAPSTAETDARRALPALEHQEIHDDFGQYSLRYVTAEGTIVTETGRLIPTSDGTGRVLVTEGSVTYIGDDGKTYITKYTAGLDGYKAEGDHIPVAPEPVAVPEPAIVPASEPVAVPVPVILPAPESVAVSESVLVPAPVLPAVV